MPYNLRNPNQPITASNIKHVSLHITSNTTHMRNREDFNSKTNSLIAQDLPLDLLKNHLIIRETEDLDYLILPADKAKQGSLCVTELYSQSLRRKVVCALRKKQQLILGKEDLWSIINQKWYLNKLSQYHNDGRKMYIPRGNTVHSSPSPNKKTLSSPSKISMLLNKMIGMQCYSESFIPIKVEGKSDRQVRINEYLRSQQLLESVQKSKPRHNLNALYTKVSPPNSKISNSLCTKKLTLSTPRIVKSNKIHLEQCFPVTASPSERKLKTFYESCQKFLTQSKTERNLFNISRENTSTIHSPIL